MNKLALFAQVAELGAIGIMSAGVGAVVGNIIKFTTPTDLSIAKKISVGIGAVVISNTLGDLAATSISNTIKETLRQAQVAQDTIRILKDEI